MGHAAILAHQGGWDEMLLVATPIALLVGLLWVANNRADRMEADNGAGPASPDPDEDAAPEDHCGPPQGP